MSRALRFTAATLSLLLSSGVTTGGQQAAAARPANSTAVGELVIEPATLINLGFEWFIRG